MTKPKTKKSNKPTKLTLPTIKFEAKLFPCYSAIVETDDAAIYDGEFETLPELIEDVAKECSERGIPAEDLCTFAVWQDGGTIEYTINGSVSDIVFEDELDIPLKYDDIIKAVKASKSYSITPEKVKKHNEHRKLQETISQLNKQLQEARNRLTELEQE